MLTQPSRVGVKYPRDPIARMQAFLDLVSIDENGCWIWQGAYVEGRGTFSHVAGSTKPARAHRVSYEWFVGPIPDGYHLHHICKNKTCVNWEHLIPLTPSDHRRAHATHSDGCVNGHLYAEHGRKTKRGAWYCRACDADRKRAKRAATATPCLACGNPRNGDERRHVDTGLCLNCYWEALRLGTHGRWAS